MCNDHCKIYNGSYSPSLLLTYITLGTISRNAAFGVKSILDYSAEEDMDAQKAKKLEVEASMNKGAEENGSFSNHITKSHEKFGDRRQSVVAARTHFYESEMACDQNMGEMNGENTDQGPRFFFLGAYERKNSRSRLPTNYTLSFII